MNTLNRRYVNREKIMLEGIANNRAYLGPKNLTIQITNACNYRCSFCCVHSPQVPHKQKRTIMPFKTIKEIVRDCVQLKTETIHISSQGEPFMHPDIYKIISLIKANGMRLTISTNGSFDYKRIREVAKIDELQINHSAVSRDVFKKVHHPQGDLFDRKMTNIQMLLRLRPVVKKQKIRIIFMLTSQNIQEASVIYDFCRANDIDGLEFRLILATPGMKYLLPEKKPLLKLLQKIQKEKEPYFQKTNIAPVLRILKHSDLRDFTLAAPSSFDQERLLYFRRPFKKDFRCYLGWVTCTINLYGHVYPCCHQESLKAGNIFCDSFRRIWESKTYQTIRNRMRYRFDISASFWKRCHHCTHLDLNERISRMIPANCSKTNHRRIHHNPCSRHD